MPKSKRRRRRGPVQYQGPQKSRPPFPINLILNVKAFYIFFIIVMIASMGAVGLGAGFGSSSNTALPIPDDDTDAGTPTPFVETFDGPAATVDGTQPHVAIIETNQGTITIDLSTEAPNAVNSFAFLAGKGFYNGTAFFYVDHSYVAQAGDPTCSVDEETICSGVGGPGYTLPLEETSIGHKRWAVVAPAVSTAEGTVHGSQFRILFEDDERLDQSPTETVFGTVVEGQDILEGLPDMVPCSVADQAGCAEDLSDALVIESVRVVPA